MRVLVDTSVWSLVLRRKSPDRSATAELASLVEDGRIAMIGPVRQELLSGIPERKKFDELREHLGAFADTEITSADYEEAAAFFNLCRSKGIQGSNTDFLICAVAARNQFSIFTTDADFENYARLLPIELHRTR